MTDQPTTREADPQELRSRARRAVAEQPFRTHTVLSSLLSVQDELGWLPPEALAEVAGALGASENDVWGVASFYPNFRFSEPPEHVVEVCWGPTCHVLGAQALLQGALAQLGLENEGATPDNAIGLKLNTCLGVCPHGPAMSFDHALAGHMTPDASAGRIAALRGGA